MKRIPNKHQVKMQARIVDLEREIKLRDDKIRELEKTLCDAWKQLEMARNVARRVERNNRKGSEHYLD